MRVVMLGVLAAGLTSPCAGPQRIIDDGLDRPGATSALRAAAKAAIDLLWVARQLIRRVDRLANIVIADDVAGADNH